LDFAADFFLRDDFFLLVAGADSLLPDVTRLEWRGLCRTGFAAASALDAHINIAISAASSVLMRAVTIA
jgi:hypothetical protein